MQLLNSYMSYRVRTFLFLLSNKDVLSILILHAWYLYLNRESTDLDESIHMYQFGPIITGGILRVTEFVDVTSRPNTLHHLAHLFRPSDVPILARKYLTPIDSRLHGLLLFPPIIIFV